MLGLANRMSLSLGGANNGGGVAIASRYFTQLTSAGTKHYTIPDYTLTIGDTVEFSYQAPTAVTSANEQFFDGDAAGVGANRSYLLMTTGGTFLELGFESTMLLDGVSVATDSTYPVDGKWHTIKLVADSSVRLVGIIGARFNGTFTPNSKIWDFVIRNSSGVAQRYYKIDETWASGSTVLVDYGSDGSNGTAVNITDADADQFTKSGADWLGVQLADDYLDLDNWGVVSATEAIEGTEAEFTATTTQGRGEFAVSGLTIGETYLIEVDARRGAVGTTQTIQAWTFATISATPITSTTEAKYSFTVVATAASGVLRVYAAAGGVIGDIVLVSGISIKQFLEGA